MLTWWRNLLLDGGLNLVTATWINCFLVKFNIASAHAWTWVPRHVQWFNNRLVNYWTAAAAESCLSAAESYLFAADTQRGKHCDCDLSWQKAQSHCYDWGLPRETHWGFQRVEVITTLKFIFLGIVVKKVWKEQNLLCFKKNFRRSSDCFVVGLPSKSGKDILIRLSDCMSTPWVLVTKICGEEKKVVFSL